MEFIDTHAHLYLSQFSEDIEEVIERAKSKNISKIILPNIDHDTINDLESLSSNEPNFFVPLMGLHPTHVKENYREVLDIIIDNIEKKTYAGIGEIGIDLYWDKTFYEEQKIAFIEQVNLAIKKNIPFIVHARDSFNEIISALQRINTPKFKGIFHAFTGNEKEAQQVIEMGFKIGIGGIVTFKNSNLGESIRNIGLQHIVLETDSPFLAPVPYRGKRNECAYVPLIASRIAEIKNVTLEQVAEQTTNNAKQLFGLLN